MTCLVAIYQLNGISVACSYTRQVKYFTGIKNKGSLQCMDSFAAANIKYKNHYDYKKDDRYFVRFNLNDL